MPLGQAILVAGFLGSSIYERKRILPDRRLWLSFPPFAFGSLGDMTLADDGLSNANPWMGETYSPGILTVPYTALFNHLSANWDLYAPGSDWRKSVQVQAVSLLDRTLARFPSGDLYFVGHSMGGLVLRFLWREAVLRGVQARIKRIVTLAAPHWGSVEAIGAFTRRAESYKLLLVASFPTHANLSTAGEVLLTGSGADYLDRIVCSWPGVYELLPNPAQPGTPDAAARSMVLQPATWSEINARVKPTHLAGAASTLTQLASSDTQPPNAVLVCVRAVGVVTSKEVISPLNLTSFSGFIRGNGDGTVAVDAQRLRGVSVDIASDHVDIVRHPALVRMIDGLLQNGIPDAPALPLVSERFTIPGPVLEFGPDLQRTTEDFAWIETDPTRGRPAPQNEPRPLYCP